FPSTLSFRDTVHRLVAGVSSGLGVTDAVVGARVATRFIDQALDAVGAGTPVLARLARRYRLGLVSNFYGNLETVCADVGLHGLFAVLKPLVPVAGVPLIESAITNFLAAGVTSLVIIVNDAGRACVERVRARFPGVDVQFIVKTTASSLESFFEVNRRLGRGRALI